MNISLLLLRITNEYKGVNGKGNRGGVVGRVLRVFWYTEKQIQSSISESVKSASVIIGSSSLVWLSQVCNLHIDVHFKPLVKQGHSGSLHLRLQLQDSSCNTTSGAGDPFIHLTVSRPSSSLAQPWWTGFGTCRCCWRLPLQMPAW